MNVLIADDHPFTLTGTKQFVESLGYKVVDLCSNGIQAFNLISKHRPEIAILDINMPGMDGIEVLQQVRAANIRTKIILLTMHKEWSIYNKAQEYFVNGFLLKENAEEELQTCIEEILKNNYYVDDKLKNELFFDQPVQENTDLQKLSFAEQKILDLITQQYTSKQIAQFLFISEKTVEAHRGRIIEKLNLPKEKNSLLKYALRQKTI